MVAAILAAQCTDARVNLVTPALFEKYPDPDAIAGASQAELEDMIRSCGFFRNKARAIIGASRSLLDKHHGKMPATLEELIALPGVGRKIASLILGDSFGIPAIVVDTHCARITCLIGLTGKSDPAGIEADLRRIVDPKYWIAYGHLMVSHGRDTCVARRPKCHQCPLNTFCDHAQAKA